MEALVVAADSNATTNNSNDDNNAATSAAVGIGITHKFLLRSPTIDLLLQTVQQLLEEQEQQQVMPKGKQQQRKAVVLPGVGVVAVDVQLLDQLMLTFEPNTAVDAVDANHMDDINMSKVNTSATNASKAMHALHAAITASITFVAEWRELSALKRSKLAGKLLQVPLDEAVEAVMQRATAAGALGSSKGRFLAPGRADLSNLKLPEGASLKSVTVAFARNKLVHTYEQPFAADGVIRLCMNCCAVVPGGEGFKADAVLENMRMLFCG